MRVAAVALALAVTALALPGCLDNLVRGHDPAARDFVSGKDYQKWVVEVDAAEGKAPSAALLSFLHDRVTPLVSKPKGVEFRLDESLAGTDRSWSSSAVVAFAKSHQGTESEGDTVALHLLFLAGHSDVDSDKGKVLGLAIGHGVVVIFADSVAGMCSGAILPGTCNPAPFFRSVVLHELGHAIGLVDNGVPMVRDHLDRDPAHTPSGQSPSHSSNRDSVMYYGVEQSALLGNLFGNNPPQDFDADDRADLKAAQG